MPIGLVRYQHSGNLHFVTFSCFQRKPYLESTLSRDLFIDSLRKIQQKYGVDLHGYVVMPEHVHLLIDEPPVINLSIAIQALKVSVSKQSDHRPFWQVRYYDFNVVTERKRIEKLNYMHWNPVKRGLVMEPEEWKWSSLRVETIAFPP